MNKWKVIAVVLGVFLFSGCGNKAPNNQSQNVQNIQTKNDSEKTSGEEMIDSIKKAMASGKEMKCVYTIKDPGGETMQTTTYVSGEKYRTEMAVAGKTQYMVFDGEAMYSWMDGQNQGTKMTMDCAQDMAKNSPESPEDIDPTGEKMFNDAVDVKCNPTSGANFSIPTEINFIDQCEYMNKMNESLKNMNMPEEGGMVPAGNLPENMPSLPQGINIPQQ